MIAVRSRNPLYRRDPFVINADRNFIGPVEMRVQLIFITITVGTVLTIPRNLYNNNAVATADVEFNRRRRRRRRPRLRIAVSIIGHRPLDKLNAIDVVSAACK